VIECNQVVNGLLHEWVSLFSEHEVIRDPYGDGSGKNDRIYEKRVEWSQTAHIEIEIHSSEVIKDKVANSVGALDRIRISVKRG
jgi:hypothetical protein